MVKRYWKTSVFLSIESTPNSQVNPRIGTRILKFFNACLKKKRKLRQKNMLTYVSSQRLISLFANNFTKKKKSGFLLNYFSFLKLGNTQFYVFLGKTLNHNFTQVTYIVDLSQISNVNMAS